MEPSEKNPPVDLNAAIELGLEEDRHRYQETQNPMWAWSALGVVLEYELPMPGWLQSYLLDSYALLMGAAGDNSSSYPARVLAALGFRRRRGTDDLREFHEEMVELKRGIRMWRHVQFLGKSPNAASVELEASEGVDSSRLRKAWKRFSERLSELEELEKLGVK
jgi:hypothetical protein